MNLLEQVETLLDSDHGDNTKLTQLSLMMAKSLMKQMEEVNQRLLTIETALKIGEAKRDGLVDWSWVRDKVMQPVIIGLVMWLLLTFIPNTLRGNP